MPSEESQPNFVPKPKLRVFKIYPAARKVAPPKPLKVVKISNTEIDSLPEELLLKILYFLPLWMILRASLVNHNFQRVVNTELLWKKLFARHFPHLIKRVHSQTSKKTWRTIFLWAYATQYENFDPRQHLLFSAIKEADIDTLKVVTAADLSKYFSTKDASGFFLFHWARGERRILDIFYANLKDSNFFLAILYNQIELVKELLVESEVNQNYMGAESPTPLFIAAAYGYVGIVLFLLDKGANVNQACLDSGLTPLIVAAQNGHEVIVKILLEKGASINQRTKKDGFAALFIAAENGFDGVVKVLLAHGADVDKTRTLEDITPLYIAAENGHTKVVHALLDNGADVNKSSSHHGTTPLFIAAENGHVQIVKVLLAHGANVNETHLRDGSNALFWAAQNGHLEVVKILLAHGAVVNQARTSDGATPLSIARDNHHHEIVRLMQAEKSSVELQHQAPQPLSNNNFHTDIK